MGKDKKYQSYFPILNGIEGRDGYNDYTIEVKNIPLKVNHTQLLQEGYEYLLDQNVVVNRDEYLEEYQSFLNTFRVYLNSKQEVQKSKEDLSREFGDKQYTEGWRRHLMSYVEPEKLGETSDSLNTEEMFSDVDKLVSEMTGSVE